MEEKKKKQLHVELDEELYNDFIELLPEKGQVSFFTRTLIRRFISESKKNKEFDIFKGE